MEYMRDDLFCENETITWLDLRSNDLKDEGLKVSLFNSH